MAALAVVAVAFWGLLETEYVRAKVSEKLAQAVRQELGLDASLGGLSFRLPFRVAAYSIRLNHPRNGNLVSARELVVVPSLWGLLRGELKIKRLIIQGARVRLRVKDGEIVNLPTFAARDAPLDDGPTQFPLDELVIQRAQVTVDANPAYRMRLDGVNLVARVADSTRVNLQLSTGQGKLEWDQGSETIEHALLNGRYRPGAIELDKLRFDSQVLKIALTKASFEPDLLAYRGQAKVEVDLARLQKLPHGIAMPALGGSVRFEGRAEGKGKRFHVQGDVHGEQAMLTHYNFGHLDLKIDANEREVALLPGSKGRIIEDGGLVGLEGKLGLSKELPLDIKVDVKSLLFQKLMKQLGTTENCVVDWHLRGGFRLKGTANPVNITGPIWADVPAFKALTGAYHDPTSREIIGIHDQGHVNGRVVIRPDALRFENLHGTLPNTDITVTVHVGFDQKFSVTARGDRFDLRDATGLMSKPIAGRGSFTLDVGPTYDEAGLTGTLDFADFAFWGEPIGHLKSRAALEKDGSAVRFVDTDVTKNGSHYVVEDMLLDFSEQFELTAKARFEQLALSDFYDTVQVNEDPDFTTYQGKLKGQASARFTIGFKDDSPDGTLVVDADLDVKELTAYGLAFDGGKLDARFLWGNPALGTRGAKLDLHELHLTRQRGAVWVRGTMDYGGKLRATLLGEALRARELSVLHDNGIALEGELNIAGTLRGTLDVPEAALDLELVGMQLSGRSLGDGHAKLHITQRNAPWVQAALDLPLDTNEPCPSARRALAKATWSKGALHDGTRAPPQAILICGPILRDKLEADLAFGLDPDGSLRGHVALNELPTQWLVPAGDRQLAALDGRLSGSASFTAGTVAQPDSLQGELALSKLALGRPNPWIQNKGPMRVLLTGHGARIEQATLVGAGTQVGVRGTASLHEGIAINVAGSLDLSVLSSFVPSLTHASGLLAVDVRLSGEVDDPTLSGRAELRDATALTELYPSPFEKLNAKLTFSEREISLDALTTQFAGGQLAMHGSAALRGRALERYSLSLECSDVSVSPYAGVDLTLSADTTLAGGSHVKLPRLSGNLHIVRARYTRAFSLDIAERLTGFNQAKRAETAVYDPALDRLLIDLRVINDGPLRIDNNVLKAELGIEDSERPFRIVGTDQRLGMLGTLTLDRGTFRFRSSEFRVEDGTVTFVDEHSIKPRIDVHARTEYRRTADRSGARWSIMLHALGDADDLKLEMSSEPALQREDIALLLLTGMTRAEAERMNSSSLTQGAALEALASVAGVDKEVKRALPLIDDFAVTSAYNVRTNRTEPQVVVGKRLANRVRASATTGLTTDSYFKSNVEWRLDDQTSVEAGYDNVQTTASSQFGNVGVDLRWRLEFD
ncbi:MAG TPA: translocation/assembly module TamB domain-containing protein [Polyangiales bacterium]|nr:translocation/assembly module TamB domain-containing protein [Polyangiales bacterium]